MSGPVLVWVECERCQGHGERREWSDRAGR
jgi:hypothetical protein